MFTHGRRVAVLCLQRMKEKMDDPLLKLALFEPVQFISLYLQKELDFEKVT